MLMIYPDKPFYVLSGLCPPTKEMNMGGWGFSVGIDLGLAKRAFEEELSQEAHDRFMKIGDIIQKRMGLEFGMPPYTFLRNENGGSTYLLHVAHVLGDACDLGVHGNDLDCVKKDGRSYNNLLEYHHHNVDGTTQAFGLLSLWLNWAESVNAVFGDKDEK